MSVTAMKLKYSSIGHTVDGRSLDPINAHHCVHIWRGGWECHAAGFCILASEWQHCLRCILGRMPFLSRLECYRVTCTLVLGEGLGTMTTEVEVGDLLDIFDMEGVLLEHTNGHDIGILGGLSNQTPERSFSGIDSLGILCAFVYTDT